MTRPHDMGGRFGDGPVVPEAPDAPLFAEDWHARALGVTLACGALGLWNIDVSRHARERLAPQDYARFSYYEKWMSALADLLVETGALRAEELAAGAGQGRSDLAGKALRPEDVAGVLARGGPADRPGPAPALSVGDAVRTRRPAASVLVEGGHTRLPAYAAGALGRIVRVQGCHVLPDSAAHGLGDAPEPLYAVAFPAAELWAAPEHPGDEVVLDLWESYLEPAEPAFEAPWHAQAFGITVALNEAGRFDWPDWAARFSGALARAGLERDLNGGDDYFACWLETLEALAVERGWAEAREVARLRDAWEAAYLRTPHGAPVHLEDGDGVP